MHTRSRSLALSFLLVLGAAACSDSFADTPPDSPADPGAAAGAGGSAGNPPADTPDSGADQASPSGGSAGAAGMGGAAEPDAAPPPCAEGTADCDNDPSNGCETQLDRTDACGACDVVCLSGAHAVPSCEQGTCALQCDVGFANCDSDRSNGCEVPLDTNDACGACGVTCLPKAHAAPKCDQGVCGMQCDDGFGDCNDDASDGCEAPLDTTDHCGACGTSCAPPAHAQPLCTNGTCAFSCDAGYADCDGDPSNGCEAPLDTTDHCGGCNTSCSPQTNSQPVCEQGACAIACEGTFANCNGGLGDGCEIDLSKDKMSCGACGNKCPVPANATATCASGTCGKQCLTGFADCDGNASTGCEVATYQDVNNCGACGKKCGAANAAASCQVGSCVLQCNNGFDDCDGVNANGCEVDRMSDPHNCGACGHDCGPGACLYGVCQAWIVANETAQPKKVAADESYVYWTAGTTVRRAPLAGGPAQTVVSNATSAVGLALSSTDVYWASFTLTGSVYRVPKSGGAVVTLADAQMSPRSIAVSGADVFWSVDRSIVKLSNNQRTSIAITTPTLTELEVDATNVYFISEPSDPTLPDRILSVPRTGGTMTTLYSAMDRPVELALDDLWVYVATFDGGGLTRVAKSGGVPVLLKAGLLNPSGVVIDGNRAWVAESGKKAINEININSGVSTYRFINGGYPAHTAQNTTTIVWADPLLQRVYAMKK